MKKIEFVIAVLLLMSTTACKKDFIQLTPPDSYTANNFYKTEAQFQSAVVAAYAPLRDVLLNDYFTSEMHSDNTIYQPYADQGTAYMQRRNISDFTNTSTNAYANATWQHSYTGISRCNIIIESLKKADISDSLRKVVDGQAKFLRALNYFRLARLYGALPLFLKVIEKADDAFIPRTGVDSIYRQIVADAQDAINELAPPAKFPQTGIATKGAATMLLADVYAIQKKWSDVEGLLNTLPAMGYNLNANYADAFTPGNKNSFESLFEIQYLGGTTTGTTPNATTLHFIPRSKDTKLLTGITVDNTGVGGWNTPSSDMIASYEAGDKRLDASVGIIEGTYDGSYYMTYSAAKSVIGYTPAAGKIGIPYIKKYVHSPLPATTGSSDDFPVYRYSEALLLLAEALNEQGKTASALIPLNRVRARAGLVATTTTDAAQVRDIIWHERRVELAFENHRWEDLLRSGKALDVINAFGVKIRQELSYVPTDSHVVTAHNLLFPIPQDNIDLNPLLTPNP
ncbi:MAG: RagB/SusD family nutrient uptake outer membrane protein [Bacteroidetes bacterium]|nr:RagB/SusD family nutrient uptake outer membrane protein [Bacteroidota bacterium]